MYFSFRSCFSIDSTLFLSSVDSDVVVLGSVIFCVSTHVGGSIWAYSSRLTSPHIFCISKSENYNFLKNPAPSLVGKSLACCIKFGRFCTNFDYPFPITTFCRNALKITVDYIFIVFFSPFFLWCLSVALLFLFVTVLKTRTANIRRLSIGSLMLAIKGAPADHDIHFCHLSPTDLYLHLAFLCLVHYDSTRPRVWL